MPFVSITRLRVRSLLFLPGFLWHALRSGRDAQHAAGYMGGALSAAFARRTFWTLTAWRDEGAMRTWRGGDIHRAAMQKLAHWCDEASVAHWHQAKPDLPGADEVLRRMRGEGRVSKVAHPTPAHASGDPAPDSRGPRFANPLPPRPRS